MGKKKRKKEDQTPKIGTKGFSDVLVVWLQVMAPLVK